MLTLLSDVRFGLRLLRTNPGFAITAIMALALGIGANTAIFSAVDRILLRPLPYQDPDRLAVVWEDAAFMGFPKNTPAPANYVDWRKQNQVFTDMAAIRGQGLSLTGAGAPEFLLGNRVTPNFFTILGVPAIAGRTLTEEDDRATENVVVISYGLWVRRFARERDLVGRTITLNREKYTVVGVMPPGFRFPFRETDFWMPARFTPQELARRGSHYLTVIARLKPGITWERARSDMRAIAKRLEQDYPSSNTHVGAVVIPLKEELISDSRTGLMVLLAGAGCVLLIACANVANLLLARAAARRREMAVRTALGAGRGRLIRQLVTESVLLSIAGGALGIVLARWGVLLLPRLIPGRMDVTLGIDPRVLLFAAAVSILTGIAFGTIPAWQASRLDLNHTLKQGGRADVSARSLARDALVVSEVAIALVLLAGAGLMIRTLLNLHQANLGFQPENLLTMRTILPQPQYADGQKRLQFYAAVLDRVRALPGVRSAAYASMLPFQGIGNTNGFRIEGRPAPPPGNTQDALYRSGTRDYLPALGARLIEGRFYGPQDGPNSPPVVIVNETMKREYFSNEDPIGKRINIDKVYTIIGVVGEIRERGLDVGLKPAVYLLAEQNPESWAVPSELVVRVDHDPLKLADPVRQAVWSQDRELAIRALQTVQDIVDSGFASRQAQMRLLSAFAALALVLALLGIYGVLSYLVSQRSREIGVRMALGARSGDVLRMVTGRGMMLTLCGLGIGTAAAMAATRAMRSMLFGISATDPAIFALAGCGMALVALGACLVPAARAARVDPMVVLREGRVGWQHSGPRGSNGQPSQPGPCTIPNSDFFAGRASLAKI